MGHKLEARWTTEAASEAFQSRAETIDHIAGFPAHAPPATLAGKLDRDDQIAAPEPFQTQADRFRPAASPRTALFAEQATFGLRPFRAFTIGALTNVPFGHTLSAIVLADYRARF
jgi:hypothetical protein